MASAESSESTHTRTGDRRRAWPEEAERILVILHWGAWRKVFFFFSSLLKRLAENSKEATKVRTTKQVSNVGRSPSELACTQNGQHPHPSPPSLESQTLQNKSCIKIHRLRAPWDSDFQTHKLVHSGSEQHRAVCVGCVGARCEGTSHGDCQLRSVVR